MHPLTQNACLLTCIQKKGWGSGPRALKGTFTYFAFLP